MRILILDDEKYRHDVYAKHLAGHEITHVYNTRELEEVISKHKYDLISLDHDLGEEEEDGMHAVRLIINSSSQDDAECVIHSLNPVGADNMFSQLEHAGFLVHKVPFNVPIGFSIPSGGADEFE